MHRPPAVAGQFYAGNEKSLITEVKKFLSKETGPRKKALGVMVPHAGYIYSGRVAGSVYGRIEMPPTVVMVGPNHTGFGHMVSIMAEGGWVTPLGECSIDSNLAEKILINCGTLVTVDSAAHQREHSLEVQLPFLQYLKNDIRIVPICLADYSLEVCRALGAGIAKAIAACPVPALVLASSDMTHYESKASAREKDNLAIKHILNLAPESLMSTVTSQEISMCGSGPTAVMLFAVKALGAVKAELTMYDTSGSVTGDDHSVVGYAGIIVT